VSDAEITVSGDDFTARFDRKTGLLAGWRVGGRDLLAGPMRFSFWRALTDNDRGWKVGDKMGPWRTAAAQGVTEICEVASLRPGEPVEIGSSVRFPITRAYAGVRHRVHGDGTIDVEMTMELDAEAPEPPRLGLRGEIPAELGAVEWFGRGPHENYVDRLESAAIGLYRSTVAEWVTPYVRPQENANRCDVRRLRFTAADGHGLLVSAPPALPLSVSAWPYTEEDLAAAKHDDELPSRDRITVNLDHRQMGVGGDNSWGAEVMRPYRIATGRRYEWTFRLEPVPAETRAASRNP
jgi:beta-galactosidase